MPKVNGPENFFKEVNPMRLPSLAVVSFILAGVALLCQNARGDDAIQILPIALTAAQEPAPEPILSQPPIIVEAETPEVSRLWFSTEYLMRWFKNSPTPPLVTTGNPNDFSPGALGQPNTRILFGGSGVNCGLLNGLQATLGGWLNQDKNLGVEISGFFLEQGSHHFAAHGSNEGNPTIYVPVFRAELGREGSFTISDPILMGGLGRDIDVTLTTRFWGAEANGIINLRRTEQCTVDLLLGFRYLDLTENLHLDTNLNEAAGIFAQHEGFNTRSQFYGAQLGARVGCLYDRFFFEGTGKVALGSSHQMVDIFGSTVQTAPDGTVTTFRGAIFTQPTNIGRQTGNAFAVAPEVNLKLGLNITDNLRGFIGYDFLYISSVVRPGNQIDRAVNETQSTGAPLIGPARPLPQFNNNSGFWSQGINFGLELRF